MPLREIQLSAAPRTPSMASTTTATKKQADPAQIDRRNLRERNRVKLLSLGFDRLRSVVPCREGEQLSKIATLRGAIWYIEHLANILDLPTAVENKEPKTQRVTRVEKSGSGKRNASANSVSSVGHRIPTVKRAAPHEDSASSVNVAAGSSVSQIMGAPIQPQQQQQQVFRKTEDHHPVKKRKVKPCMQELDKENRSWSYANFEQENAAPVFPTQSWPDTNNLFQTSTPVQQSQMWSSSSGDSGFYGSGSSSSFQSANYYDICQQSPSQPGKHLPNNWQAAFWNFSGVTPSQPFR
ncbi:achaete-scute complex 3 [Cichlidogyrus casuarinus]|uniref:Achaete-scute complex 3 n=1 Tax=Cichlidogyrus casuarinus TaxID=1844966 RepID=A0ABD2Q421_9PLAT